MLSSPNSSLLMFKYYYKLYNVDNNFHAGADLRLAAEPLEVEIAVLVP